MRTEVNYDVTGAEWLGQYVFFYAFLPALVIAGIWAVVHGLRKDADIEAENDMIRVDVWLLTVYLYRKRTIPPTPDMSGFKGWRDPTPKCKRRLVAHREKYGA